jgi:CheY-like chemotaxis protein
MTSAVLIVEDDGDLREILGEILRDARFSVVLAADGADALAKLRASPELPGLILLDIMMPVLNGFEFRAAQRSDPRLAAIPVVVMSAVTSGDVKADALQPAAFLPKPLDREDVIAVARRFCCAAEVAAGSPLADVEGDGGSRRDGRSPGSNR